MRAKKGWKPLLYKNKHYSIMFNRFTCALTTDLHYTFSNNAFINASYQLCVNSIGAL